MESTRPPIRHEPLGVVLLATANVAIEPLVARWLPFVGKAPTGSQLIVVADSAIGNLSPRPRLRIIHHAQPLGLGPSLQTAIWSLETPLVLFVPSDNSLTVQAAHKLLDGIDPADMVVAARHVGNFPPLVCIWDIARSLAARIFLGYVPEPRLAWPGWAGWRRRWVARHLFGAPLLDPESGVVLARRSIFGRIPIQSKGSFAWIELVAKANHLGCLLGEVKIDGPPRPSDHFARDAWRVFRDPDFGPA